MAPTKRLPASFRDPGGFCFRVDGTLYRQVNRVYKDDYDRLVASGLCTALTDAGLLIPHTDVDSVTGTDGDAYRIIRPEEVPFVSYPYEWCFGQLKQAALTTLTIQKRALDFGMSLKDASAYNIQFNGTRAVLIDTLSFERYREGEPWIAYGQFCRHFLAPLALMALRDVRMSQLLRVHIDGVPLDLASRLLPLRSRLSFGLFAHIHLHARSQRFFADKAVRRSTGRVSLAALRALIDSLEKAVGRLSWEPRGTEWADYYDTTNYSADAAADKRRIVASFVESVKPRSVWDLGANTGVYSRLAARQGASVIAFDADPGAVEAHFRAAAGAAEGAVLPLLLDLTNPSSALGWAHRERMSLAERGPCDMALALALVHHLAISNNVPLDDIAAFLRSLCRWLAVEFVPKSDSQVQRLLSSRDDIFVDYTQEHFEQRFARWFDIRDARAVRDSSRVLYLMQAREAPAA